MTECIREAGSSAAVAECPTCGMGPCAHVDLSAASSTEGLEPLSEGANHTVQLVIEALQDLDLMQRVADYARGRDRDGDDWQARLDQLYKEIY